jgi:hypothetical protein
MRGKRTVVDGNCHIAYEWCHAARGLPRRPLRFEIILNRRICFALVLCLSFVGGPAEATDLLPSASAGPAPSETSARQLFSPTPIASDPKWMVSSTKQARSSSISQFTNNPLSDWRLMQRTPPSPYTIEEFSKHAYATRWELTIVGVGLAAYGIKQWNWGSSGFKFKNEGFFGKDTQVGGTDKLGHAFSTYLLSDFFHARLSKYFGPSDNAALSASLMSFGTMFMVEVFDGLAEDHGFSYEDLIADAAGATFSYLRNTIPGLRDKLDYRLQYLPSSGTTADPISDYMGQKYLLALKLAGFEEMRSTPFRFVELHAGYFARGYGDLDKQLGVPKERYLYAGVGLNLNELLFSNPSVRETIPGSAASLMLEYFQVPYTSINTNNKR